MAIFFNMELFIFRLIQEEKHTTEQRAEELESRVGSIETISMLARGRSFERNSPPQSGRSTPKSHHSPQRDYLQKYPVSTTDLNYNLKFNVNISLFTFHKGIFLYVS